MPRMTPPAQRYEFGVRPGDPTPLRPLSRWCADRAREHQLAPGVAHDLDLCLHEAVSNIFRHGCADGRGHSVAVSVLVEPARVELVVEDDGPRFDPTGVPVLPPPRTLAEAADGGRGIAMMRAMAREMRYEFVNGRNRLTLVLDSPARG